MEKLILQSNDAMLLVVNNVDSMSQIYGIKAGINGSQNSKLIIGTSNSIIVAQLGLENISLTVPSMAESVSLHAVI